MPELQHTYLIVTGTAAARSVPELLDALNVRGLPPILTLLTPNARRIISPRELALVPGHRLVVASSSEGFLPPPPAGLVLAAPCSFTSLSTLASGLADNQALSIASESFGRGLPIVVALALNTPLWRHP